MANSNKNNSNFKISRFLQEFNAAALRARFRATLNRGAFEPLLPGVPGYENQVFGLNYALYAPYNLLRTWNSMALAEAQRMGLKPKEGEGLDRALERARAEIPKFSVPTPSVAEWRSALELFPQEDGRQGITLDQLIDLMAGVSAGERAAAGLAADRQAFQVMATKMLPQIVKFSRTEAVRVRVAQITASRQAAQVNADLELNALFAEAATEIAA